MMGHRQVDQAALFYEFSLGKHIPPDHLLRSIDRFVELGELRRQLAAFYSTIGRPSVDPELVIRMLIVGYCFGIRSERRLWEKIVGMSAQMVDHYAKRVSARRLAIAAMKKLEAGWAEVRTNVFGKVGTV
jgi:transposase